MGRQAGFALVVLALGVGVALWYWNASGPHPREGFPRLERGERAKPGTDAARREPDRRFGFERLPGASPGERLREMRARELPTPAVGGAQVSKLARRPSGSAPGDAEDDIDPDDFESLSRMALHDQDPDNRIVAAWLLASVEDAPVRPVLAQVLDDPDPEVRLAAVESISDLEDLEENPPLDLLEKALGDEDAEVRFEALSVLGDIGGPDVEPLVRKALQDPDEDVRSLAESLLELEEDFADEVASP
ncbi:MAG: hypothetical protein KatS3mg076_2864 [Candidatus Binatia bacterium]|nr:MAG: hypothetical protein KatS3mg076_2864 [Candidatus Binatia bacterium]